MIHNYNTATKIMFLKTTLDLGIFTHCITKGKTKEATEVWQREKGGPCTDFSFCSE